MLKQYPTFRKGQSKVIYDRLPKKERKIIDDFVRYCSASLTNKEKIKDVQRIIIQFRHTLHADFNKLDLQDLRDFLTLLNTSDRSTYNKNDIKVWIKKFLRWHFPNWTTKFNNLEDVKTHKANNEKKINSKTLLKQKDIEKVMKAEPRTFWKTFFITLYESGLRPIELRNLKWKDISFNVEGEVSELHVYATKTHKARDVFIKEATYFLKKLQNEKKNNSEFVFASPSDETKPITKSAVCLWFKNVSRILERDVFSYLLRHSRASELYLNAGVPDKIAQKFLGHSKNMADVYTHMSSADVKEAVGKTIYDMRDLKPEDREVINKRLKAIEWYFENLQEAIKKNPEMKFKDMKFLLLKPQ